MLFSLIPHRPLPPKTKTKKNSFKNRFDRRNYTRRSLEKGKKVNQNRGHDRL